MPKFRLNRRYVISELLKQREDTLVVNGLGGTCWDIAISQQVPPKPLTTRVSSRCFNNSLITYRLFNLNFGIFSPKNPLHQ